MIFLYIVLAIILLLFMIMVHELGHYLAGKLFKFKIEEFSIGFGKPIISKKMKSGETFSLRWVPLGGYCAFKGEDEEGNEKETFNSYPAWQRLIVLVSGALFNFVTGIIFSFILLLSIGSGIVQISNIVATNGNENILHVNDIILEVDGKQLTFINGGISGLTAGKDVGDDIVLTINRDGEIEYVTVTKYQQYLIEDGQIQYDDDNNPIVEGKYLGITSSYVSLSFFDSLLQAIPYTFNMAWECLEILGKMITGQLGLESIGGPVSTVQSIAVSAQASMKNLVVLFPLIAVNLAVFNLLPIPALDGARMVFVLIEWIFRKPVPRKIEGYIHSIGLIVLFSLVIIIDILRFVLL